MQSHVFLHSISFSLLPGLPGAIFKIYFLKFRLHFEFSEMPNFKLAILTTDGWRSFLNTSKYLLNIFFCLLYIYTVHRLWNFQELLKDVLGSICSGGLVQTSLSLFFEEKNTAMQSEKATDSQRRSNERGHDGISRWKTRWSQRKERFERQRQTFCGHRKVARHSLQNTGIQCRPESRWCNFKLCILNSKFCSILRSILNIGAAMFNVSLLFLLIFLVLWGLFYARLPQ